MRQDLKIGEIENDEKAVRSEYGMIWERWILGQVLTHEDTHDAQTNKNRTNTDEFNQFPSNFQEFYLYWNALRICCQHQKHFVS